MPIIVAKDNKTKMITARVVPSKEVEGYAAETVNKMVERLGHRKIIMRSDNEPVILALKDAARRECHLQIVLEKVPVGDHQTNKLVENAVNDAQGQFRVAKDALQSRRGRRVDGEHQVAPWMVTHAASVVSRGRRNEGLSACRRWKGREFTEPAVCCVRQRCRRGRASSMPDGKKECGWGWVWRVVSL